MNYDLGVRMGTQDSAEVVTEVGVAFWKGKLTSELLLHIYLSLCLANTYLYSLLVQALHLEISYFAFLFWLWSTDI